MLQHFLGRNVFQKGLTVRICPTLLTFKFQLVRLTSETLCINHTFSTLIQEYLGILKNASVA